MGRLRIAIGIASLCLVVSACGAAAATKTSSSSSTSTTTAHAPPACVASSKVVCIVRAGERSTTHARVGQTVKVVLGGSLRWSGPRVTGSKVLRQVGQPVTRAGNYIVTYDAIGKGRVTLEATGAPICSVGQACPQFILLWRTQVVVTA